QTYVSALRRTLGAAAVATRPPGYVVRADEAGLDALRFRALVAQARAEPDLAAGRHAALVAELEALVAEHPYRERLRALLMLALYRAGRQADALAVFQDGRRILGEELGLEPSHELRQLESAILAQDRSLDAPATIGSAAIRTDTVSTIPDALT